MPKFIVERMERWYSVLEVEAEDVEDALRKIREGIEGSEFIDTDALEFVEYLPPISWIVRDEEGNVVY